MNPADDGRITTNLKDDSYTKEKILEKQKRLSEHKDLLKEKLKFINETVKRSSLSSNNIMKKNNAIGATNFPGILNQKKPSASKTAGNVNNANINITKPTVIKTQTGNNSGTTSPKRNLSPTKRQHQENQPTKPEPKVRSPVFTNKLKSPKRQSTSPEPSKLERVDKPKDNETKIKPTKVIKVVKKKKKKPVENVENNKYFQREFMETYTDKVGYQSFKLPKDEYQDLMSLKQPNEEEEIYVKRKMKKKCFLHVCPDIETKEEDGSISNCFIDSKLLVLAQTEKILAFSRKGKSAKDWILKDSMSRIIHDDVIKEIIIKCYLDNVKETTVLCEVYLLRNKSDPKIFMKMAQYRFLSENGKLLKEYLLGSFDCELENFTCCSIGRRQCCVAVCAWSRSKGKSIAWVFTHCIDDDTMKCTPMIPLKHEVTSLHDLSVSNNKLVLLAFGRNCFTVWSAKTGERFTYIDLRKVLPVKSLICHFGVFAIIQRGFLFIMTSAENHLYMIAVNLASRNSKPLRRYRLPRGQICLGAAVKEDKLIAISNKSVVCWDLQTSAKLQHLKTDGAIPFLVKNKVLLMDENRFSRLLTIKSEMDKHLNKMSTDSIPTTASVQSSRTSIATSTDDL